MLHPISTSTVIRTLPVSSNPTPDLNIHQAIESLEAHLATIRKEMPWHNEWFAFDAEGNDGVLLSEFIEFVNADLGVVELEKEQFIALSSSGFQAWLASMKSLVAPAALWASVTKFCQANRCSVKIKAGDDFVEVQAANAADAERLMKCASRMTIFKKSNN